MKKDFLNFGEQLALIGTLTIVAFLLAINLGYFIARDFGRNSQLNDEQMNQHKNSEIIAPKFK